ncbi:MAG: threonine/serine exporter family protein [Succinivibrio sp.]
MLDLNFTTEFFIRWAMETGCASFIAVAFAMLFQVPVKYLGFVALGGAVTRCLRTFLFLGCGLEVVVSTFIACSVTSLLFIYIAPKLKVTRVIFTVASIISLIPGMDAYQCLIATGRIIEDSQTELVQEAYLIMHHGMRCFGIMLGISLGIAVPPLFFYRYRFGKS